MPYLDLCVYPPNSKHTGNVESTIDFERLSVCSMESVHVPASRPLPQVCCVNNMIYTNVLTLMLEYPGSL